MNLIAVKKMNVISLALLISIILLFSLNLLIISDQKVKLVTRSKKVFTQAETIASQVASSLDEIEKIRAVYCSPEYIEKLKIIRWKHQSIEDVASAKDGFIHCSALWGVIDPPLLIKKSPEPALKLHKFIYIKNNDKTMYEYPAIMDDNAIAFVSRDLRDKFLSAVADDNVIITSQDGTLELFNSRKSKRADARDSFLNSIFMVNYSLCNEKWSFCVKVTKKMGGLSSLTLGLLIFVIFVLFLLSILLSAFFIKIYNKKHSIEFRIRKAVIKNRLHVEYQPIIKVIDNSITGFEALLRWHDPVLGNVPPDVFIKASEKSGCYHALSEFLICESIKSMSSILNENSEKTLSLNISDHEISNSDFVKKTIEICNRYQVNPAQIKLEISERCQLPIEEIKVFSEAVDRYNIGLSIDDFGIANANLAWLTSFRFNEVKIDRYLIERIDNKNNENILLSICNIIKSMGKKVVFEGVECKEQLDIIKKIDKDCCVQGWYFYPAIKIGDINHIMKSF